ncbi:MAG: DUF3006 domain-containing protein [Gemmatimonadota bacterium]|nr:DUF3006 domain-containing protein [Gemmatimonadota bacterium]
MGNHPGLPPGTTPGVWVVDQIENGAASVEMNGGATATVPIDILPRGTGEGDVLRVTVSTTENGEIVATIEADPAEKARRLAQSAAQITKGGKGGTGDITL